MSEFAKQVLPVALESEMRESYLAYAMSVIVGRALPDVRDGLKPVHRRVLFAMNVLSNDYNKPYKKSARIVGDVIGKYHPHGDTAVYDTIVRMAQDFSLRYPLVDGQGNFGSVDGDSAAAMRYTEIRMAKIAHDLLADLDKETVDFSPNYDGTEQIPDVLPAQVPNLLVNGSSGIAVGMATNIPPHNLTEVVGGAIALLDDPDIGIEGLMEHISGPDFPTAGIINGKAGILQAYQTGRGRIYMRARAEVLTDEKTQKQMIVVSEIPYQVNKARLIEKIAELVKEKKLEGITELRDESDKDGMRIVIELRRGEMGDVVLNNLYSQTQMQNVFGINMVALVDGQPRLLTLREILDAFIRHRREVVSRRTTFLLRKARDRGHILEGLAVALANIDEVIELIKTSPSSAELRVDGLDSVDEDLTEWVSEFWVNLGVEGGSSNINQEFSSWLLHNFEFFEELKSLGLSELHTLNKDSWMNSITDVSLSLSHDLSDEKDTGGGSISNHIVLSSSASTNHSGGRMLNLHLVEEDSSIFGELNLTSSTDEHFDGSLWTEVGLEDLLETFSGVDIDAESLCLSDNISVGIYHLEG